LLARHPSWGVVALPLLARLYVRKATLPRIASDHRPVFRTKLVLAVELVQWAVIWLKSTGQALWVVVDGAYAKAPFLKPLIALGVTVVSRLRKDAALFGLPESRRPGEGREAWGVGREVDRPSPLARPAG
jgi:DDE superfamily endonuclease